MGSLDILIGGESFREIRENHCCYVDKTMFLEEMCAHTPPKISLITRPRHFGKTLTMSMLAEFFDIKKQSADIFENLKISKNKEICSKWMNKYPVINITLKDLNKANYSSNIENFLNIIYELCIEHSYLIDSDKVYPEDRALLQAFNKHEAQGTILQNSLKIVSRALNFYWEKPVIILIDEYDTPINYAWHNGYYGEMIDFMRGVFSSTLKDNPNLKLAVVTGSLRIGSESIFTGVNNFRCFTIAHSQYADVFGFTAKEVEKLLSNAGFYEKCDEVKEWYEGYRFGDKTDIYCPWDILNYIADLKINPNNKLQSFWIKGSRNYIIREFIEQANFSVKEKIETLLCGGSIVTSLLDEVTYDSLYNTEEHFWTVLYAAGFLTRAEASDAKISPGEEILCIPNREIFELFKHEVRNNLVTFLKKNGNTEFFNAFWAGEKEILSTLLTNLLLQTISYYDYQENFYYSFLVSLFSRDEYIVRSYIDSSSGRTDIIVYDVLNARCAVIEVKLVEEPMTPFLVKANEALQQIKDKYYTPYLDDEYDVVHCWSMVFRKKKCLASYSRTFQLKENLPPPLPAKQ